MWIFWVVIITAIVWTIVRRTGRKAIDNQQRTKLSIPKGAVRLAYLGGHPLLQQGTIYGSSDDAGIHLTRIDGTRVDIPFNSILGIHMNADVQTVNTGGGRSIGGAVAGAVIAGPVGAVVGGRKKTKIKDIDRSTVLMKMRTNQGNELDLIFKGGQPVYNSLTKLLAPSM